MSIQVHLNILRVWHILSFFFLSFSHLFKFRVGFMSSLFGEDRELLFSRLNFCTYLLTACHTSLGLQRSFSIPVLSLASLWMVPQLWFMFFSSVSTVLRQVVFSQPHFRLPSSGCQLHLQSCNPLHWSVEHLTKKQGLWAWNQRAPHSCSGDSFDLLFIYTLCN